MKEIRSIVKLFDTLKSSNEQCALAQVVRVEESSYRREGARMIVFESGVFEGGISGGCLEGDALTRSQMAILRQEPSVVTYDTSKEKEIGIGLGCNGVIDVLISPVNENLKVISILKKCLSDRKEHILATITSVGNEDKTTPSLALGNCFYVDGSTGHAEDCEHNELKQFIESKAKAVSRSKKSQTFTFQTGTLRAGIFIESIPPQFHLAIYGDNYDVYPMIDFARVLDWEVSLVGNIQKLKRQKLTSVSNLYPKDQNDRPDIDQRTAVILMAHDFKTDSANLQQLCKSRSPYIAVLGPKKRYLKMLDALTARGIVLNAEELSRIYAPCGLEIGANVPDEIAISIIGEILSVFSGKAGGMLRDKEGPIHERA